MHCSRRVGPGDTRSLRILFSRETEDTKRRVGQYSSSSFSVVGFVHEKLVILTDERERERKRARYTHN